jgi:epoxyqueuosine reductase
MRRCARDPGALVPGAIRVISVRMDYWPASARRARGARRPDRAYVSRYALGRDYHKVLRTSLQALADRIAARVGPFGYRVFCDSAPVMEVALRAEGGPRLARQAHAAACRATPDRSIFLGEIYTDLPLPLTAPVDRALRHLPRVPRRVPDRRDRGAVRARRAALHQLPDDRARTTRSPRSCARSSATASTAATTASSRARGTATRRRPRTRTSRACATARRRVARRSLRVDARGFRHAHGRQRDPAHRLRALAAQHRGRLGNAPTSDAVVQALRARADDPSALVREHVAWALRRHHAA